ncbi:hypothetical protein SteCoe_24531 [Stentor coeruleus]|uniref:Uncharacterized protein n=1 Tax=Stentor coeruleus TaxID=5963 RepID=A0A1R2BHE6_9CILI|nr:hypothetical protein SteCoe_24531 [Stentor coeruleus]
MCNGKIGNCYTFWNDTTGIVPNIPWGDIDYWENDYAYYQGANMSVGWAQATAMATTYSLWLYRHKAASDNYDFVVSEASVILNSLKFGSMDCRPPNQITTNYKYLQHMPFISVDGYTHRFYGKNQMPFNYLDIKNYCNRTILESYKLANEYSILFTEYSNVYVKSFSYNLWVQNFRGAGFGLVSIANDYRFAAIDGYYPDGVYRVTSPILYYYPAVVVGIWLPGNGTTFLLTYAFGAKSELTNFLWVNFDLVSVKNFMTFLQPVYD